MINNYVVVNGAEQRMSSAEFSALMSAILARGAPFRFQASGFSMYPFIRDGDVVTLAPAPARLCLGDVAAFINPYNDRLTLHRVVSVKAAGYLAQGDSLPEPDGYIPHAEILGRVVRVEHRGRYKRLGLGVERVLIAFLSRHGWLAPMLALVASIYRFLIRGTHE